MGTGVHSGSGNPCQTQNMLRAPGTQEKFKRDAWRREHPGLEGVKDDWLLTLAIRHLPKQRPTPVLLSAPFEATSGSMELK